MHSFVVSKFGQPRLLFWSQYYCLDGYHTLLPINGGYTRFSNGLLDREASKAWFTILIKAQWHTLNMINPHKPRNQIIMFVNYLANFFSPSGCTKSNMVDLYHIIWKVNILTAIERSNFLNAFIHYYHQGVAFDFMKELFNFKPRKFSEYLVFSRRKDKKSCKSRPSEYFTILVVLILQKILIGVKW